MNNLKSQIESLLFASGEPVAVEKMAKFLKIDRNQCQEALEQLQKQYQEAASGLGVINKDGQVQMVSAKQNSELVAKFLNKELSEDLSPAAAEVLAVVAYRGPITRAQIEQIRGVNCSFTLRNLAMRGLVERKDNPTDSRSYLYETSFNFLKALGLSKIEELPDYQDLSQAEIVQQQIAQIEPTTETKK